MKQRHVEEHMAALCTAYSHTWYSHNNIGRNIAWQVWYDMRIYDQNIITRIIFSSSGRARCGKVKKRILEYICVYK